MDFGQFITSINYWAVLVSAFCAFFIGWIWYGPLFGKLWMKLNGFFGWLALNFGKNNIEEGLSSVNGGLFFCHVVFIRL